MENNNLTSKINYQPATLLKDWNYQLATLVKDSNSGLVCQKHLFWVVWRPVCTSKLSDVITLF